MLLTDNLRTIKLIWNEIINKKLNKNINYKEKYKYKKNFLNNIKPKNTYICYGFVY